MNMLTRLFKGMIYRKLHFFSHHFMLLFQLFFTEERKSYKEMTGQNVLADLGKWMVICTSKLQNGQKAVKKHQENSQ